MVLNNIQNISFQNRLIFIIYIYISEFSHFISHPSSFTYFKINYLERSHVRLPANCNFMRGGQKLIVPLSPVLNHITLDRTKYFISYVTFVSDTIASPCTYNFGRLLITLGSPNNPDTFGINNSTFSLRVPGGRTDFVISLQAR